MIQRGDVVIVDFPFTDQRAGKVRPALVVQNDRDNQRLRKTIIAMISGNLRWAAEPTHLLIDPGTPDGALSGLHGVSVVVCVNLYTIEQSSILRTVGHLSAGAMAQVNECLKAALGLS
jgi:mRNA interferase MazF